MNLMKRWFGAKTQGTSRVASTRSPAGLRGAELKQAQDGVSDESEDDIDEVDGFDLHVCSWCGRFLAGDFEDEIDGDGPGADICGDCNRTKNFEAEMH
jgi:hypothetical protein